MNYGILVLYIGDMIVVGTNNGSIAHWKLVFSNNLTWMVWGLLIKYSGCKYSEIENSNNSEGYVQRAICSLKIQKAKPVSTFFPIGCKLSYQLMVNEVEKTAMC